MSKTARPRPGRVILTVIAIAGYENFSKQGIFVTAQTLSANVSEKMQMRLSGYGKYELKVNTR